MYPRKMGTRLGTSIPVFLGYVMSHFLGCFGGSRHINTIMHHHASISLKMGGMLAMKEPTFQRDDCSHPLELIQLFISHLSNIRPGAHRLCTSARAVPRGVQQVLTIGRLRI